MACLSGHPLLLQGVDPSTCRLVVGLAERQPCSEGHRFLHIPRSLLGLCWKSDSGSCPVVLAKNRPACLLLSHEKAHYVKLITKIEVAGRTAGEKGAGSSSLRSPKKESVYGSYLENHDPHDFETRDRHVNIFVVYGVKTAHAVTNAIGPGGEMLVSK